MPSPPVQLGDYGGAAPPAGGVYYPDYAGSSISGAGQSPNFFGMGSYVPPSIPIAQNQFNNPLGGQGQQLGSQELGNYLGNTTKPVVAAQAAQGSQANYNTGTAGQLGMAGQYAKMAAGQGPSLATVQAQQQGAANIAASESMLGSARGSGNPAAAQLGAQNTMANQGQQIAQNAVAGRTQEEMGALGAETGIYGNVAQQGLGEQGLQASTNQFNAGQTNQVGMSNQANTTQANTAYLQGLLGINAQQQQGQIAGASLAANTQLGQEGIAANAYNNAAQRQQGFFQSIMGGASTAMAALAM